MAASGDPQHPDPPPIDPYGLLSCEEANYGSPDWRAHLLEQYKLYVEMADRISSRRMLANTFFLTVNTALLAALAFLCKEKTAATVLWVAPGCIALLVLCYVWRKLISSYRMLNTAKFEKIVPVFEQYLPTRPYVAEWVALGEGKDPALYTPLTAIESRVPLVFSALYAALALMFLFAPNSLLKYSRFQPAIRFRRVLKPT